MVSRRIDAAQKIVDDYYLRHGPRCAGCDFWRYHNSVIGECTRTAPVSGEQRYEMVGLAFSSIDPGSGHIMTTRDHLCGDFVDTHDWGSGEAKA